MGVKIMATKKCPQKPILVFPPSKPAIADPRRYAIVNAGEENRCAKLRNMLPQSVHVTWFYCLFFFPISAAIF